MELAFSLLAFWEFCIYSTRDESYKRFVELFMVTTHWVSVRKASIVMEMSALSILDTRALVPKGQPRHELSMSVKLTPLSKIVRPWHTTFNNDSLKTQFGKGALLTACPADVSELFAYYVSHDLIARDMTDSDAHSMRDPSLPFLHALERLKNIPRTG